MTELRLNRQDEPCSCVNRHSPAVLEQHRHALVPESWGCRVQNPVVGLCPTSHINAHRLLNLYIESGGKPHGFILRAFNHELREYAAFAWANKTEKPLASSFEECLALLGVNEPVLA